MRKKAFSLSGFLSLTDGDRIPMVTKQTMSKIVLQKQGKGSTLKQGPGNGLLCSKATLLQERFSDQERRGEPRESEGREKWPRRARAQEERRAREAREPKNRRRREPKGKKARKRPQKGRLFFPQKESGGEK